jgi:CRISPR-associated exonuclease Cas4
MQLVVYLLLVAADYGERAAAYGYVRYRDHTFRVQLSREEERRCLELRDGVKATRRAGDTERSHQEPGRCARCSFRDVCGQNLA